MIERWRNHQTPFTLGAVGKNRGKKLMCHMFTARAGTFAAIYCVQGARENYHPLVLFLWTMGGGVYYEYRQLT